MSPAGCRDVAAHQSSAQVVIFVKSVARAIELDKLLVSCNFPSIAIHSGLAQEERYVAVPIKLSETELIMPSISRYTAFKAFEKRILVATDIFGRGIDVERVNIVVNYDCPSDADSYLHRVGLVDSRRVVFSVILIMLLRSRAGRFGTKGLAITFVSSESDQQVMAAIQSRFEVAVPELPDHIDPASYSAYSAFLYDMRFADEAGSDILISSTGLALSHCHAFLVVDYRVLVPISCFYLTTLPPPMDDITGSGMYHATHALVELV